MALPAIVRGLVRAMIRSTATRRAILDRAAASFPWSSPQQVGRLISEELRHDAAARTIMGLDKRRTTDLGQIVGCKDTIDKVRIGVTINYRDERTGEQRRYSDSHEVNSKGRLATILNEVLAKVIEDATRRGSPTPGVTSAMTAGPTNYRIDFVSC